MRKQAIYLNTYSKMSRAKRIVKIGYRIVRVLITNTIKRVEMYVEAIIEVLEEDENDKQK